MGDLVGRANSRPIRHVRDATYYGWRYRNPSGDYRFIYAREDRLEGFLVLQRARLGNAADIGIVDWEASRPEILESMLSGVVRNGGFDMLSIWTATLPDEFTNSLHALGFKQKDESRGLSHYRPGLLAIGAAGTDVMHSAPNDAEIFSNLAKWDLRMAYSDAF